MGAQSPPQRRPRLERRGSRSKFKPIRREGACSGACCRERHAEGSRNRRQAPHPAAYGHCAAFGPRRNVLHRHQPQRARQRQRRRQVSPFCATWGERAAATRARLACPVHTATQQRYNAAEGGVLRAAGRLRTVACTAPRPPPTTKTVQLDYTHSPPHAAGRCKSCAKFCGRKMRRGN
jgi:hypothetical protein